MTYREFDDAANKIANALIARGVKTKSKIALLLPRNSREIISMYGVLKAGCAFIPCDIKYPAERINQILDDSAAPYVITTSDKITSEKFIDVEELLKNENITRPQVEISPNDLAYLIYTSGSTGKPKGVMIPHRSIANFFTNNPAKLAELIRKTGGGEKYLESLLKKLQETTNAGIINTYGPTETTFSSNMKDLTHAKNILVGRRRRL